MGITFKEDVADIRNSKVVDLIHELEDYSLEVDVIDPCANPEEVMKEYQIKLKPGPDELYDAIIIAVGHSAFKKMTARDFQAMSRGETMLMDIKGVMPHDFAVHYSRL